MCDELISTCPAESSPAAVLSVLTSVAGRACSSWSAPEEGQFCQQQDNNILNIISQTSFVFHRVFNLPNKFESFGFVCKSNIS